MIRIFLWVIFLGFGGFLIGGKTTGHDNAVYYLSIGGIFLGYAIGHLFNLIENRKK